MLVTRALRNVVFIAVAVQVALLFGAWFVIKYKPVQTWILYLHRLKYPLNLDYGNPEYSGYAPGKASLVGLMTSDGVHLGAWHVLPNSVYEKFREPDGLLSEIDDSVFKQALVDHPTVLYFHGNSATRGLAHRVNTGRIITALDANYFIIDYRGFGDSDDVTPTEKGLHLDAIAAWDYLVKNNSVPPSSVTLMGQSLGTGVATSLASSLCQKGITPNALALIAPFSSIILLIQDFKLFGKVPIMNYISRLFGQHFSNFLADNLDTHFNTQKSIQSVTCPILIAHAIDDMTIPYVHSFDIASLAVPAIADRFDASTIDYTKQVVQRSLRRAVWDKLLLTGDITTFKLREWAVGHRVNRGPGYGALDWIETANGGHINIGTCETIMFYIRDLIYGKMHK